MASTENGSTVPTINSQPEASPLPEAAATEATEKAEAEGAGEEGTAAAESAEKAVDAPAEAEGKGSNSSNDVNKWPGWPGDCVFRIVVPVLKVGSIIGRKGELIKKMCEETRAKIRVLDGPIASPNRIVLISGKEEPEAALSPAMDAVIRIFKRISGLPETESDGNVPGAAGAAFCSIRLLVASTQAINLIGKQGSLIKSIQESTGASVRVLSNDVDEMPISVNSDERIVELQGETLKVLKALEAVVRHLRKFLVDHSVLPLFEKNYNAPITQERPVEPWSEKQLLQNTSQSGTSADYTLPVKRDFFDRENRIESQVPTSLSFYGQDPALSGLHSSGFSRAGGPIVTQVAQTMQIPLDYAEDIIGVRGTNIAYIRNKSKAILTVQESRGLPDEITVEIKGTSSQVQVAQQLIQEFISGHKGSVTGNYGKLESGLRPSYSELGSSSYQSSSYSGQPYGGSYGSSGVGGYGSYRL